MPRPEYTGALSYYLHIVFLVFRRVVSLTPRDMNISIADELNIFVCECSEPVESRHAEYPVLRAERAAS